MPFIVNQGYPAGWLCWDEEGAKKMTTNKKNNYLITCYPIRGNRHKKIRINYLHRHRSFDCRMRIIIHDVKIAVLESKDIGYIRIDPDARQWTGIPT